MTATDDLLTCPFCGRRAEVYAWWNEQEECGCASVGCTRESYTNGYECARIHIMRIDPETAKRDAIDAWNRRVQ